MTTNEIKEWLRKCAASCREYEDHIMAECYEATLAKINADEALIAELVEALDEEVGLISPDFDKIDALIAKAKAVQE